MPNAHKYEQHLLCYLGLRFDPDVDYTQATDQLHIDLIHYRGRSGALKTIKAVMALVEARIQHLNGQGDRPRAYLQRAFLRWLGSVRERLLRPSAPMPAKLSSWPPEAVPAAFTVHRGHRLKLDLPILTSCTIKDKMRLEMVNR